MSENRPEIHEHVARNGLLAAELLEIADINREFLKLLLHTEAGGWRSVLGLEAGTVEALRRLGPEQQETVASVPLLLAEFGPLPGFTDFNSAIADGEPPFAVTSGIWRQDLQGFVDRLLVCVWQAARRETGLASLCLGIDGPLRRKLVKLSFAGLSRYSRHAATALRARFAGHSAFWPDLLASAYSNDPLRKTVSQLSAIQLSVGTLTVRQHRSL
jgi:hypothetical protein